MSTHGFPVWKPLPSPLINNVYNNVQSMLYVNNMDTIAIQSGYHLQNKCLI